MTVVVNAIVEGDGDEPALRLLIQRLAAIEAIESITVQRILKANGKGNLTAPGGVERFSRLAAYDAQGVLVVLDADESCPMTEAQALSARVRASGLQVPVAIVEAKSAFEAWFLADIESLAGASVKSREFIPGGTAPIDDPESLSAAKGRLTTLTSRGTTYKETTDQVALSALVDLDRVQSRSRSFRRLIHALQEIHMFATSGSTTCTP